MASGFTVYGMSLLLRSIFTPDTIVVPSTLEFAACYAIPVLNATADQLEEPPEDSGYMRASISLNSESWGVSGFGEIYNLVPLEVGTPNVEWGAMYGWALIDTQLNECVNVGELIDPLDPVVGQPTMVTASSLVVGLQG